MSYLGDAFEDAVRSLLHQMEYHFVVLPDAPYVAYEEIGKPPIEPYGRSPIEKASGNIIDSTATVIDPDVLALPAPVKKEVAEDE